MYAFIHWIGTGKTTVEPREGIRKMANSVSKNAMFLMINDAAASDLASVRAWLGDRDVRFYEARDIFDAIDEFCDFTVEVQPDLILVPSKAGSDDADWARKMIDVVAPDLASDVVFFSVSSLGLTRGLPRETRETRTAASRSIPSA